jgi:glycosyltransferase involved in cell wall biosynthesis
VRLLLFNLATDADDPILGFATRWIWALAKQAEFIHVITMRAGRVDVPKNVTVHSVGKEKGYSEPRRVIEFYRLLLHVTRSNSIDACFSHMMPRFTVLAAPILKAERIPIVTWYAHPSLTWTLKLAHHFSGRVVSSIASSYPYRQDKLVLIGHGIDGDIFSPNAAEASETIATILCVGRLSPVKDHPTLLKAAQLLRRRWPRPFRVVIIGALGSPRDEVYVDSLHEYVREHDLADTVSFESPVPVTALPPWYRCCTVHVNLTPNGFVDKVALEAMSCGKPSLVANEGFRETLGAHADALLFRHADAEDLAKRLIGLLALSESDRKRIGLDLRRQIARMHSLDRLVDNLTEVFQVTRQQKYESYSRSH